MGCKRKFISAPKSLALTLKEEGRAWEESREASSNLQSAVREMSWGESRAPSVATRERRAETVGGTEREGGGTGCWWSCAVLVCVCVWGGGGLEREGAEWRIRGTTNGTTVLFD